MRHQRAVSVLLALAMCAGMVPSAAMAAEAEPAPVQEEELLTASSQSGREIINFNPDWRFNLGDASGAEARNYDDSDWRELDLPHDYSIEQDFTQDVDVNSGALPGGVGWYRKTFVLPADMAGKNISIEFGGVYMDSTTYVNGQLVGNYPYGYSPFAYDITDLVVADGVTENVIAVRVNNQLPSSRWYSGSGIYRNVKMVVTDPVHVARYGTYVTTPDLENEYADGRAAVNVKTEVENEGTEDVSAVVTSTILDAEGNIFAESASTEPQTIAVGETVEFDQDITTDQPALWSVDDPNLYTMETTVTVDGEVVDTYSTTFGFRWLTFTTDDGFYLNGEYMKLNGVCMHHDQGALGAVANYRAIERQMETMKEMGVNAIRVTHNPAADELLEICDRLGLMVIDEAFDCWEAAKRTYDYHRFFDQVSTHPDAEPGETWAEFDIKNMVERGKNDPCVIMWSLGNEIVSASVETAQKLNGWVKEVDTTRPTTQGYNNFIGSFSDSYMKQVADVPDIAGFNYGENGSNPSYDQAHVEYPDWIIIGSETSSAVRSRGYYYRDNNKHIISSYDDGNTVGWGSSMEHAWQMNRDRKWILGEFMWTGFDYIGEPSPLGSWPSKSSYFGAVDTAGIPKDAFYMYQSVWTSVEEDPMVHLLPHWNWEGDAGYDIRNADSEIAVQAYSNAPSVELFLNGESLGRQDFDQLETEDGRPYQEKDGHIYLQWMVPYEPGELKAVAYDEDDNVIATDVIRTSGEPAQIRLTPDREIITADGEDLSYILVEVLDEDGDLVPTADDLVNFQVSGNGVIAGVDNGDQTAVDERYKDNKRKAFSGKAMLIVQSTDTAGSISITASSAGLTSDSVTVFTTTDESGSQLLGYEALPEVVTAVDTQPELPATVTAVYSNGSKEDMAISWDEIDGSLLAEGGMFTTSGTVVETGDRVSVTVVVAEYLGLRDAYIVTAVGTVPALPETVTAVYNTGDTTQLPVIWERTLTEADVAAAGTVTVEGSVEGFSDPARAVIEVRESEVVYDVDIAQRDGTYPIPTASYINSGDPVEAINNGAVYHSGGPAGERWIPWNHGEVTEWCQLELEEAAQIGKVGIDIWNNATDGAMSLPDTLTIQYSNDGEEWIDIASKTGDELDAVDGSMDGLATAEVVFDFSDTPVNARFIRWKFDNAARKSTGVGEVHVYSNQIKLDVSSVAQLEGIQIGGEALEGFDPATYNYTVEIPYGADVPEITAAAAENGSVYVIPAMGPGRSATILVTAEDGETTATYSIFFQVAAPVLDQVEVSIEGGSALTEDDVKTVDLTAMLQDGTVLSDDVIDVTYIVGDEDIIQVHDGQVYAYNAGETTLTARVTYQDVTVESAPLTVTVEATTENKTIIGYEQVNVTTDKGVAPELPSRIMATFDKGLAKDVDVVWDEIPETDYADYGVFTVKGTVAGQALRPTATVVVKGVVGVQQFSTAIPVRFIPTLPARANVYYSDGTMDQRPITWEECTQDMFTEAGEVVTVSGEVDGMPTQMVVRVSDQGSYNENDSFIAYRNGFYLPLPFASFSNLAGSPLDSVGNIYDNQITQDETQTPKSIWSNWVSDPRPGDYVGVVFGYEDVTEKTLDRLDVYYFHDFGTTAPASVQIQYYVGEDFIQDDLPQDPIDDLDSDHFLADDANWADVEDQVTVQGEPQLEGVTTYTFDAVQTCAIRLVMENQEGMAIGISEIRAYDKNVDDISGEAALANIYLDGEPLEGFAPDTYTYTYELSDNALPEVTVETSGNNESATVIGPVLSTGTDSASVRSIQILVTSEDGATSHTYEIQFTAPDTGDQDAVAAAKAVVESGSYTVAQSTANDEAAVKTWLTGKLNSDLIGTGVTVTEADITIQSIVPAVAGTEEAPDGTDGSFTFTVALAKGEASAVTEPVTGTIAATNAVRTYTVTFDSMGGTAVEPQTVDAGGKAAEPADPTRDGYTFDGWYTDADCTEAYDFESIVTADITLYAGWTEVDEPEEPDEPDVDEDHDAENASTVVTRPGETGGSGSETPETPDEPGTDIDEPETPLAPGVFTDVPAGHWASEAIAYVTGEGYFNGTSETTFGPSVPMSRAMLATVLWRMEGQPAPTGANTFTDVPAGQWYTDAVTWAAEQGIVTGTGGGLFDPEGNITREQLAVMLYRYAGGTAAGADLSAYPDASSVSSWAVEAMGWAVSNGILSGNEAGQLSPGGAATRAEVAQMLLNYSRI